MSSNAKRSETRSKPQGSQQQNMIILGVMLAVVLAVGLVIVLNLSNASGGSRLDYSSVVDSGIIQERTNDGGFIIGDPSAPVTLVEFADFLCPHCQQYYPTMEQFIEEFVLTGQARFEFRMLPTQGGSPAIMQTAECASEQYDGGFFPVHDEIFSVTRASGNTSNISRQIADEFGLDLSELLRCASDANQFSIDQRLAGTVGVTGTPGIRIRYGDGPMQAIPGVTSGAPDFDVLAGVVLSASLNQ